MCQGFIFIVITLENWIGVAQTAVMLAGVVFAIRQLSIAVNQLNVAASAATAAAKQTELAAKASQAAALVKVQTEGTDILWKVIDDPTLHQLFDENSTKSGFGPDEKVALVRGMLIRQFATIYRLRQMDHISDDLWPAWKADISEFFRSKASVKRWRALERFYDSEFRRFINVEILNLAQ